MRQTFGHCMASFYYVCAYYILNDCSVKILLHIPNTCTASSQYDIECVILCFRSVKIPHHTPGICMVSPQYEFAYAFSSHRCLEILLHTPGKSKAFSSLNVQMVVQVHFSESCFISLSFICFFLVWVLICLFKLKECGVWSVSSMFRLIRQALSSWARIAEWSS